MKTNRPLLEFDRVTVVQGDENKRILNDVSLEIGVGENVAILGPNGAGKSSLIRTIAREYYPFEGKGTVRIWGKSDWNLFELRGLLGVVSNELEAKIRRDETGMEAVLSGFFGSIGAPTGAVTALMRREAERTLDFLEVRHLAKRRLNTLSSGEGRRFMIARALVHKPKALLLDEPTNSLDLAACRRFKETIRKICRGGTSIILVTQTLEDIIPEIGRVLLMKNGRIIAEGAKEMVLSRRALTDLYGIPVNLTITEGYYRAG